VVEVISSHRTLLMGFLADQPQAAVDLRWVEQTGSTNADLLAELAAGSAGHWSIRIASRQSHGRGRQGRSWESPDGSIAISIAVELTKFQPTANWLSMLTAAALVDSLNLFSTTQIEIKWPNDCLTSAGKIAGILIERNSTHAVIGVGINFFAAPQLVTATHLGITNYVEPLARFIKQLQVQIQKVADLSDAEVKQLIAPILSTIGKEVEVHLVSGDIFQGTAIGITDTGALIVRTKTEDIEVLSADVTHLRSTNA
jgi:BirA family transcriptional regulator, biotin operon repressor / biotin---[acetyl-CoA-carboxylase] ligase